LAGKPAVQAVPLPRQFGAIPLGIDSSSFERLSVGGEWVECFHCGPHESLVEVGIAALDSLTPLGAFDRSCCEPGADLVFRNGRLKLISVAARRVDLEETVGRLRAKFGKPTGSIRHPNGILEFRWADSHTVLRVISGRLVIRGVPADDGLVAKVEVEDQ